MRKPGLTTADAICGHSCASLRRQDTDVGIFQPNFNRLQIMFIFETVLQLLLHTEKTRKDLAFRSPEVFQTHSTAQVVASAW